MNRDWHLLAHYLDLARHEAASTFDWEAVKTNIGAGVWWAVLVGVITALVYPPLRKWIRRELDDLHRKLDHNARSIAHIIKHHPDIPPLPDGRKSKIDLKVDGSTLAEIVQDHLKKTKEIPVSILSDIEHRFTRYADEAVAIADSHAHVDAVIVTAAKEIASVTPLGAELDTVLNRLQDAWHWAHSAIAANQAAQPAAPVSVPVDPAPAPEPPAAPAEPAPAEPTPVPAPVDPAPAPTVTEPVATPADVSTPPAEVPAAPVAAPAPATLYSFSGDPATVDATVWPLATVVGSGARPLYTWAGTGDAPVSAEWTVYTGVTSPVA